VVVVEVRKWEEEKKGERIVLISLLLTKLFPKSRDLFFRFTSCFFSIIVTQLRRNPVHDPLRLVIVLVMA